MSDILDINLAAEGQKKIDWVSGYMPILNSVKTHFEKDLPLDGIRVSMSIHLEAKTAYLAKILKSGGAEVHVTGCNPLSTQDDIAAALAADGFDVNARRGVSDSQYFEHLKQTLSCHPHVIIDDGGDFTNLLHGECSRLKDCLIGGAEETTTGIHRLRARHRRGELDFPMMDVNDADCKHLFDNRYGTGQSTLDGIMHTTNLIIAGKTVVVAGYGWCGRGVAMRAKGMGAVVIVTEVDSVKAIEAVMDGFTVMPMEQAAPLGDLFITLTGCRDVIRAEHFAVMKNGAILANSGHFDVEIDKSALKEAACEVWERKPSVTGYKMSDGRIINLLAEGRLVNLAAGNGHPAEIMDMSFALQALCLEYMVKNGKDMSPGVYQVPAEIDRLVAEIKLRSMGVRIDCLTDKQKEYLDS